MARSVFEEVSGRQMCYLFPKPDGKFLSSSYNETASLQQAKYCFPLKVKFNFCIISVIQLFLIFLNKCNNHRPKTTEEPDLHAPV